MAGAGALASNIFGLWPGSVATEGGAVLERGGGQVGKSQSQKKKKGKQEGDGARTDGPRRQVSFVDDGEAPEEASAERDASAAVGQREIPEGKTGKTEKRKRDKGLQAETKIGADMGQGSLLVEGRAWAR